ncbi:MAG: T9SS type A sorting domain-containing protein [candidate division WOR-3 bacterium]
MGAGQPFTDEEIETIRDIGGVEEYQSIYYLKFIPWIGGHTHWLRYYHLKKDNRDIADVYECGAGYEGRYVIFNVYDDILNFEITTGSPIIEDVPTTIDMQYSYHGPEYAPSLYHWYFKRKNGQLIEKFDPPPFPFAFPDSGKWKITLKISTQGGTEVVTAKTVKVWPASTFLIHGVYLSGSNNPTSHLHEWGSYYIKYSFSQPGEEIKKVEVLYSPDNGQNWPTIVTSKEYQPPIPWAINEKINWIVKEAPTKTGKIKLKVTTIKDNQQKVYYKLHEGVYNIYPATPGVGYARWISSQNCVKIGWYDYSKYDTYYELWYRLPNGILGEQYIQVPGNGAQTGEMETTLSGEEWKNYIYRIRCVSQLSVGEKLYSDYTPWFHVSEGGGGGGGAQIEAFIPPGDIPSNNSKRLFIKNDTLHILYSKNSLIYDAILKDSLIEKIFLGYGKNPACFLYKNNLYSIWAYNDTTTLEKIEFTKIEENPSPTLAYTSSNTYLWGIGAPGFYIKEDTAYTIFETSYGPTYHPPLPGPHPAIIKIWAGKLLNLVKFPINNPENYEIIYQDFIQTFPETLRVIPVKEFYDTVLPKLISPSICVDEDNLKNIIWDGINKYLKIYKVGNDTIIKTFYPQNYVNDPYVSKENSFIRFIWVEDSSKIFSSYTFRGKGISEKELIYEGYKIKEPFINKNYIVFVENDGEFDNLCFGEIKIPFEKEILFSDIKIRSPQILFDKNKFHITFYSGDTVYNLYKIEKEVLETPADIVINLGGQTPSPLTIYREGYISLGIEDYKNLDYGDSLIYEIPLYHASKVKIKFEAYLDREVKEKIYINNHPLGVWHIKENNYEIYEKQIVPPILDSILKIKIEKKQGDKVYLGKLSIYIIERSGGGIQGAELKQILKFSLNIIPNIIKDKAIFEIIIPEKQKINLSIYDASGRKVLNIINKELVAGIHRIDFENKLNNGIYFAILKGKEKKVKKFTVLR